MEAPYPTVRAAAAYGLSSIISDENASTIEQATSNANDGSNKSIYHTEEFRLASLNIALSLTKFTSDASPLVRREIALALGVFVSHNLHLKTFAEIQQGLHLNNNAEEDKESMSREDLKPYAGSYSHAVLV